MKEYIVEVDWKNGNNEDAFSVIHIPYKKKMNKFEIEDILKNRFVTVVQWKII